MKNSEEKMHADIGASRVKTGSSLPTFISTGSKAIFETTSADSFYTLAPAVLRLGKLLSSG